MTFDEFCKVHGFEIKAKPSEHPERPGKVRWHAELRNARTMKGTDRVEKKLPDGMLSSIGGAGSEKAYAVRALAKEVQAQLLITYDTMTGRREVRAPKKFSPR